MSKKMLLQLISISLVFAFASSAYAQSTEVEDLLNDCEAIIEDVAEQRDKAIQEVDKTSQERDEARGRLLFITPEYEALKSENKRLIREVSDKPSRVTWAVVGSGGTVIVGLLTFILIRSI